MGVFLLFLFTITPGVHAAYVTWGERPVFVNPEEPFLPDRVYDLRHRLWGMGVTVTAADFQKGFRMTVMMPQITHVSGKNGGYTKEFWYYEFIGYLARTETLWKIPLSYGIELGFLSAGRFMLPDDTDLYTRLVTRFVPFPPNGTLANLFVEFRKRLGKTTHGLRITVPFSFAVGIDTHMNAPLLELIYTVYWR